MWWTIILIGLLLGLVYLFFAPLFIEINTASGLFRIRFHQMASTTLLFTGKSILVEIKVFGWTKQYDLLDSQPKESKPIIHQKKRKRKGISASTFKALMKSFRIKRFFLRLDTGNMPLNGILYPVFLLLNKKYNQDISINFLNNNILILQIENRIARILWAFVKATILK